MYQKTVKIFLWITLLLLPACVQAQGIVPWFRSEKKIWQEILTLNVAPQIPLKLSVPLASTANLAPIKNGLGDWVLHSTQHTGILCSVEKQLLRRNPEHLFATSGKLAYLQDRDIYLKTILETKYPEEKFEQSVFDRRQQLFVRLRGELEKQSEDAEWEKISQRYFLENYLSWMDREEIQTFTQDKSQPIPMVSRAEAQTFSTLTFQQQQAYAARTLQALQQRLHQMFNQDPASFTDIQFEQYYVDKIRLEYFKVLNTVMQQATQARPSIIVRFFRPVALPFLPQAQELLTDAQRLGKLLFYAQSGLFSGTQQEILLAELKRQEDLFYSYAEAEAFDVPYHQVLDFYANTVSKRFHRIPAEKIFGQEAAQKIEALSGEQVMAQVPVVLEKINAQQVRMHSSSAPPTPEDYLEYFKIEYKKRFYQFLLYRHTPIEQLIQRAASSTPN